MGKRLNNFVIFFVILFCLLFTVLQTAVAAQKALLIGVGTYKHLPYITSKGEKLDNLKGPANDVQKIKDMLISVYNFREDNILVLKDQEATREAILGQFNQWLVKGTRPGDLVLFYYSGHGTRIPKAASGFYKAICPYDTLLNAKKLSEAKLIINEELGELLGKLRGREVVVIMDSCHSGGMTRSIRGIPVDELELTPAIQSKYLPIEITDVDSAEINRGMGLNIPKRGDGFEDRISILSSREDQLSVEMTFPSGVIQGAFTAALLEGIGLKKDISYREWFEQAKKTIKDKFGLEQDPQLKTNKGTLLTRAVFQSTAPGTGSTGITAQKSIPKPQSTSTPGPLELKENKVLVRLDPISGLNPGNLENLQKKLKVISYIELVNTAIFDCLIRGEFKSGQFNFRILTPTGDIQRIPPSGDMDALIKSMTPYLEYTHLVKKLAVVNNPSPPFKVKVWMNDKDRRDFKVGEKAQFFVSSDKDCYLVMLNLDAQGGMRIIFPNRYFKNSFIRAGQVLKIPDEKMGQKFDLEFGEPVGQEVVKLIATEKPFKLENLGLGKLEDLSPAKLDYGYFGPKGLIEVPERTRAIVVKKVEEIPTGKGGWSEDSIVIRSHK